MTIAFATERLQARPWSPADDAGTAYEIYSHPDVARYISTDGPMQSVEAARAYLEKWSRPYDDPAYGTWAVEPLGGGAPIGSVVARPLPPGLQDVEIGWHLRRDAWGQGYGTELGRAAARHAFAHGVSEVYAVIVPGNDRSSSVAKKIGMEYVGRTDKYYERELDVYRLRPDDLIR